MVGKKILFNFDGNNFMDENEEQIKTELVEAILLHIENYMPYASVLEKATLYKRKVKVFRNENLKRVITELDFVRDNISKGSKYSEEDLDEIFTSSLEQLITR